MDREEKQIGQMCVVVLGVEVNRAWKRNKEVTRKRNKEVKPVVVVWSTSRGVRDTESERKRRRRPREGSWNGGKKKICLCVCLLQRVTGLRVGFVCVEGAGGCGAMPGVARGGVQRGSGGAGHGVPGGHAAARRCGRREGTLRRGGRHCCGDGGCCCCWKLVFAEAVIQR